MTLKNLIISEITRKGPMMISSFMEHCLYNQKFGYYTSKKNTISNLGDFITSPEISQVFGELIGIWLAKTWIDRGKPTPFSLVELGPGNGTMMRDILKAMNTVTNCVSSASIILVETSPILQARQKFVLEDYHITWVKTVSDLPDQPIFLIANEFLDALPIRQFKKNKGIWYERSVDLAINGDLHFVYTPSRHNAELHLLHSSIPNNTVVETSDAAKSILSILSEKLTKNSGVSLFIDYGYFEGAGETLQAVNQHSYANPLENLGQNDLTAQVNFKDIYTLVQRKGLRASRLESQGTFLKGLGIKARSEILAKKMSKTQKTLHLSAINRLVNKNEMGNQFKVMGFTNMGSPALPLLE